MGSFSAESFSFFRIHWAFTLTLSSVINGSWMLIFMSRGQIGSSSALLLNIVKGEIIHVLLERDVLEKKQKLQTCIHWSNRSITEVKIFYSLENCSQWSIRLKISHLYKCLPDKGYEFKQLQLNFMFKGGDPYAFLLSWLHKHINRQTDRQTETEINMYHINLWENKYKKCYHLVTKLNDHIKPSANTLATQYCDRSLKGGKKVEWKQEAKQKQVRVTLSVGKTNVDGLKLW